MRAQTRIAYLVRPVTHQWANLIDPITKSTPSFAPNLTQISPLWEPIHGLVMSYTKGKDLIASEVKMNNQTDKVTCADNVLTDMIVIS